LQNTEKKTMNLTERKNAIREKEVKNILLRRYPNGMDITAI